MMIVVGKLKRMIIVWKLERVILVWDQNTLIIVWKPYGFRSTGAIEDGSNR